MQNKNWNRIEETEKRATPQEVRQKSVNEWIKEEDDEKKTHQDMVTVVWCCGR